MTDNEIIKALECCSIKHACSECPYTRNKGCDCINGILKDTFDLINRLQADIERLKNKNEILSINADTAFQDGLNEAQGLYAEQVKAEVIKEFAERLKDESFVDDGYYCDIVLVDDIDGLLKAMVGDTNDT